MAPRATAAMSLQRVMASTRTPPTLPGSHALSFPSVNDTAARRGVHERGGDDAPARLQPRLAAQRGPCLVDSGIWSGRLALIPVSRRHSVCAFTPLAVDSLEMAVESRDRGHRRLRRVAADTGWLRQSRRRVHVILIDHRQQNDHTPTFPVLAIARAKYCRAVPSRRVQPGSDRRTTRRAPAGISTVHARSF